MTRELKNLRICKYYAHSLHSQTHHTHACSTPRSVTKKSNILSKLRRVRKESKGSKPSSQSWDSALGQPPVATDDVDESYANEEELPEPPPVPTVEYLLGKRPVNLRKRASDSLRREITGRANEEVGGDDESDDGHSSVSSSTSDQKRRNKKRDKKRHKRRGSRDSDEEGSSSSVEWSYNKLSISPPRDRKPMMLGVERHPTPIPAPVPPVPNGLPSPLRLDSAFDEVSRELLSLSDVSDTPSSLSPLHSPSPKSPVSPIHLAPPPSGKPSRSAPKPPPHLQMSANKQPTASSNTGIVRKVSPLSKVVSSRGKAKAGAQSKGTTLSDQQVVRTCIHDCMHVIGPKLQVMIAKCTFFPLLQAQEIFEAAKSPNHFMAALNDAISSSPKLPRFMRQGGVANDKQGVAKNSTPPESSSPTIDEIELQLNEMRKTLESSKHQVAPPPKRPPSPELESDSSEYSSSSEDESTSSYESSSSSDEGGAPRRPIMACNVGMSAAGAKRGNGVFNRARLLARYPRLLRRNLIKLAPIVEQMDEAIHGAVSYSSTHYTHRPHPYCVRAGYPGGPWCNVQTTESGEETHESLEEVHANHAECCESE